MLAEIRRLNKTLTIPYSNILSSRLWHGESVQNCQSCGEEISEEGICEICSDTNQRPASAKKPIIFLIVVIAIIVIIALIFTGASNTPTGDTLDGTISSMTATNSTNATIIFDLFNLAPEPMDIKIILTPTTGTAIEYWFAAPPMNATTTMVATTGTAVFIDNYAGNTINSGDRIEVTGLEPGMTYKISIFHYPSGVFHLTGETELQMPP